MNAYVTTTANTTDFVGTYVTEEIAHAVIPNGYVSNAPFGRAEGQYVSHAETTPTRLTSRGVLPTVVTAH